MGTQASDNLAVTTDHGGSSHRTEGSAYELFGNRDGNAFVDIYLQGHRETYPVSSKVFRHWLALELLGRTGKAPTAAELKRHIELLQAKAVQQETLVREVYVRAAVADSSIYIDLADNSWSAVEINADGRRTIQSPPVHFVRVPGMRSLPIPQSGGSIETLRALVNVRDDNDFVLVIAWLLNTLRGNRQHPPLVLSGPEGTAKTTLVAILRALVDPSCTPLGGLPRTERELATLASQGYLLTFDNVSALSIQMSNALCRLSTGGGARPVIINGIDDVVTRPDLADRCLFVTCDSIPDERRRSEGQLWAEFENAHAQIFGLLLDALSHGLRMLPETHPDRLPRMADFALWATACESAFWPQGTFSAAYRSSAAGAVEKLIGADPVASAVRQLATNRPTWKGTASELDNYLRALTGNLDFTAAWPSDSARLATRLRQLAPSLNKVGIEVSFIRSGHNRTRLVTITARTGGTEGPEAPTSDQVLAPTQPKSPSAPSAADHEKFKTTAEDSLVPATATDAFQHNAATEPGDDGKPLSDADAADAADAADGADGSNNRFVLAIQS